MNRFMVIRTTLVMGALVLSAGCVQPVWVKDGATQQQFSADQFDCKQKAYTMVGGYNTVNNFGALAVHAPGFFNECMQSKGYSLQYQRTNVQSPFVWLQAGHSKEQVESAIRECQAWRGDVEGDRCMRGKGYLIVARKDTDDEQMAAYVNERIKVNMAHGEKVWIKPEMSILEAEADYRRCDGVSATHRAQICMEGLGYGRLYPTSLERVGMTKAGMTKEQMWADKLACDAPVFEDVKACLWNRGYTYDTVVQRAAQ